MMLVFRSLSIVIVIFSVLVSSRGAEASGSVKRCVLQFKSHLTRTYQGLESIESHPADRTVSVQLFGITQEAYNLQFRNIPWSRHLGHKVSLVDTSPYSSSQRQALERAVHKMGDKPMEQVVLNLSMMDSETAAAAKRLIDKSLQRPTFSESFLWTIRTANGVYVSKPSSDNLTHGIVDPIPQIEDLYKVAYAAEGHSLNVREMTLLHTHPGKGAALSIDDIITIEGFLKSHAELIGTAKVRIYAIPIEDLGEIVFRYTAGFETRSLNPTLDMFPNHTDMRKTLKQLEHSDVQFGAIDVTKETIRAPLRHTHKGLLIKTSGSSGLNQLAHLVDRVLDVKLIYAPDVLEKTGGKAAYLRAGKVILLGHDFITLDAQKLSQRLLHEVTHALIHYLGGKGIDSPYHGYIEATQAGKSMSSLVINGPLGFYSVYTSFMSFEELLTFPAMLKGYAKESTASIDDIKDAVYKTTYTSRQSIDILTRLQKFIENLRPEDIVINKGSLVFNNLSTEQKMTALGSRIDSSFIGKTNPHESIDGNEFVVIETDGVRLIIPSFGIIRTPQALLEFAKKKVKQRLEIAISVAQVVFPLYQQLRYGHKPDGIKDILKRINEYDNSSEIFDGGPSFGEFEAVQVLERLP